jgi:hypothetical protein
VTSALPILVSHRSNAFLRVIDFLIQLTVIFHAGSPVPCHNFCSFCLCFNKRSGPGKSLFMPESVSLFVDSFYAETIETVKSHAAWSSKVWRENFSRCNLGCSLWFCILQLLLGVSAAPIIGGIGFRSLHQLAVTACWCGSSVLFLWALLVKSKSKSYCDWRSVGQ